MSSPIFEDLNYIYTKLGPTKKFKNKNILITGCAGIVGFYLSCFFKEYKKKLGIRKIIGVDNNSYKSSPWTKKVFNQKDIIFLKKDINKINFNKERYLKKIDYIFHMATVASPYYFDKDPINVFDTNCFAYKNILEFYKNKKVSILYFSTSELYGTPEKKFIPTKENFIGKITTLGPRACYDESKRAGETLSYIYNKKYNMNIKIVRLFNTYGPGQSFNDRRAISDFARNVFYSDKIIILSSKKYTRSFCYVADTVVGVVKALLYNKFEVFNIGNSKEEINMYELSKIFKRTARLVLKKNIKLIIKTNNKILKDVPVRRCPDIKKSKKLLNFEPKIGLNKGILKYIKHLKVN